MNNGQVMERDERPAGSVSVIVTPMQMIERALSNNASLEVIEKFMALQERWEKSEARKAFDAAIAGAKATIEPAVRNATGHNNRRYANFAAIAEAVKEPLAQHGLSYRFRTVQAERISVTCILSHRDGHSEENTLSGPPDKTGIKNDIQAIGSTLTYLQRYSLIQALGIATTEDDDGKAAGGVGSITDEQADSLRALLNETKTNVDAFLRYFKAQSVADMPAAHYAEAVSMLEQKRVRS